MKLTLKIDNATDRVEVQKMLAKVSELVGYGSNRGSMKGGEHWSADSAMKWNLSELNETAKPGEETAP